MAILANVLVTACLGMMSDGPVAGPGIQTTVVVPDGGMVLLGGLKAIPVLSSVVQNPTVPDGGTILLGGLKRLAGSVAEPAVVIPDGGTIILGGLKRLR